MFVVGQDTKKRPDGLTFVRMFDGKVLDMLEVGIDNFVSLENFKVCILLSSRISDSLKLSDEKIYSRA